MAVPTIVLVAQAEYSPFTQSVYKIYSTNQLELIILGTVLASISPTLFKVACSAKKPSCCYGVSTSEKTRRVNKSSISLEKIH